MAKDQNPELIIEDWDKGIAPSPLLGFGNMQNVDITSSPGSVRINNLTTKKSGSTVTTLIIGFRTDPNNTSSIWAYDNGAVVYHSTDYGVTWAVVAGNSSGTGTGIAIWKDYLFVATTTKLDVYGPLSGSPSWSTNWQTLDQDLLFHTMLESIDDALYICNGRWISKLEELTTFSPPTAASYLWNRHAIILASYYRTKTLADLGQFLMIGAWKGTNFYDFKVADIFPYSRSDLTLGIPLKLNENGVNAMLSLNNRLYVQAGIEGKIFECDSVSFVELSRIPHYICNLDGGKSITCSPGAMISQQGKIFIGFSTGTQVGNMGVWSIAPQLGKNVLLYENVVSTGNMGGTNSLNIGALLSINRDSYLIGWQDGSTYGIDMIDNSKRYTGYVGIIESPLYHVGESLGNRTFHQLEVYFQKPLVSGQGIIIKYRKDLTSSFMTLGTYDFSTEGGVLSFNKSSAVITSSVFLQIRIELTTASSSNLSPELKRVMFKASL